MAKKGVMLAEADLWDVKVSLNISPFAGATGIADPGLLLLLDHPEQLGRIWLARHTDSRNVRPTDYPELRLGQLRLSWVGGCWVGGGSRGLIRGVLVSRDKVADTFFSRTVKRMVLLGRDSRGVTLSSLHHLCSDKHNKTVQIITHKTEDARKAASEHDKPKSIQWILKTNGKVIHRKQNVRTNDL